jgi:hypothetical protein
MPALSQVDEVGGDVQIKILSGVQAGGGAAVIKAKWELADFKQRESFQKVMKQAVRRAQEVAEKRGRGGAISAEEEQVEALVADFRNEFPVGTRGTPAAVRKIIHEQAP